MKVTNEPDHPVTDADCKKATGKTLKQWFKELDAADALKLGRRDTAKRISEEVSNAWWATTIAVEYEGHKGIKKKDGLPEGYSICVTKSIAAPVTNVYQVWTDAKKFAEMFGDGGKQVVKEGGELSCAAGCKGKFTRVRADKDLRFTWEHPGCTAPMLVDVMFQDAKGKCLMNVLTSRIQTRAESDGLRNAWTEALNRLKVMCEKK
ncbi:MAG: SRPBCC domain-containing protein [Planctomycetaceae bacterium]|jgi:uncharacterized protein YndB with AHSA1/START domain|nr:SRPBCC domain-containing protein [Planctomycetaceae bacterium]